MSPRGIRPLAGFVCAFAICLLAAAQEPKRWAVIVGISKFEHLPAAQQLEYADADAEAFHKFIRSERGRAFPEENIQLLLNEKATRSSMRTRLGRWLQLNAKSQDIVYIFIATHGMVEKEAPKAAYLVTSDAEPENLYDTALPLSDLNDAIANRLKAGRVVLFADACRAGKLGEQQRLVHQRLEEVTNKNTELIGLMASGPTELSQEGKQFCGGHGAFTCFLLKGLEGAADANKDNTVTIRELIRYLNQQVPKATDDLQNVREFGNYDSDVPMSYPDKPGPASGISLAAWKRQPDLLASLRPVFSAAPSDLSVALSQAIQEGRLLSPAGKSAWEFYLRLAESPALEKEKEEARAALAIAMEDEGQKLLRAYLHGDADPLSTERFRYSAELFLRASTLTPEFPKLKARAQFCDGRALVAEGKYTEALATLQGSIAIDPGSAYTHNALGIAYLRLRRYKEAVEFFQSAVERARQWAYPHYNLALTYTEMRRLPEAERAYKAAIERGPKYAYLHVNLGALYQSQKRMTEAEKEFRLATELSPNLPDAHNKLGLLYRTLGKHSDAEEEFRRAIQAQPKSAIWRLNLAKFLRERQEENRAERVLREALLADPNSPDVHRELGDLLLARGRLEDAEKEFLALLLLEPTDARTFILLGDARSAQKRFGEASSDYRQALQLTDDSKLRRGVERKLQKVGKQ